MNELQVFNNPEFGVIRSVEIDGQPWLVGKDVATALGYAKPTDTVRKLVEPEDRGLSKMETPSGTQEMTVINESGLYSLVMSSKLPRAKVFKRWVTSEVLPSIRKSGGYIAGQENLSPAELMAKALMVAQKTLDERDTRILALQAENEKQKKLIADFEPMKRYIDTILQSPGMMKTSQIAADYDLSAVALNKILHEAGIQRKVGDQWILYARHMGKGYTSSETFQFRHKNGMRDAKVQTVWSQKGRLLIHDILTKRGIKATMDR